MLNPVVDNMLKTLENMLRNETLTPAKNVDDGTFVCFTEKVKEGMVYHQMPFETIPQGAALFKNKPKGAVIGPFKIVGVYHVWLDDARSFGTPG